jgi:hypothetical protein
MMMNLEVGRRRVPLPDRHCEAEDVRAAVGRLNPPFVALDGSSRPLVRTRRPVYLAWDANRVRCEDDAEVAFACRLVAVDHSSARDDSNWRCMAETRGMEEAFEARMAAAESSSDSESGATEEDDISIEGWSQMGYSWFRNQDACYV